MTSPNSPDSGLPEITPCPAPRASYLRQWLLGSLALAWLVALIVRITLRDRLYPLAIVCYALPLPVFSVGALVFVVLGSPVRGRLWRPFWALALIGCSATWFWTQFAFRWSPDGAATAESIRIVTWNTLTGRWCTDEALGQILMSFDADVLALVEAHQMTPTTASIWQRRLPGYRVLPLRDGLALLIRGDARLLEQRTEEGQGRVRVMELRVKERTFTLALVDILSSLARPRQHAFQLLEPIRERWRTQPTIMLGDFNTPPDSVCFDAWRADWTNAFEAAGNGYSATWPVPAPVLALDQVWGSSHIDFQRTEARWTLASDHRPVVVDFRLRN